MTLFRQARTAVVGIGNRSRTERMRVKRQSLRRILAILVSSAAVLGMVPAATAAVLQIAAVSFALRSDSQLPGEVAFGMLTNAEGTYYAPVVFPVNRRNVCRFTLVARDNDADFGITARLIKKPFVVGGNPFQNPVVMARVRTGAAAFSAGVRRRTDRTINEPLIDANKAFYYVELIVPATTLEVLGVQIVVKRAC